MALVCVDCGDAMTVPGQLCQACLNRDEAALNVVKDDARTRTDQFKTLGEESANVCSGWRLKDDEHPGAIAWERSLIAWARALPPAYR